MREEDEAVDILILGGARPVVRITSGDILSMTKDTDDHTQRGWGKTSASFGPDGGSRQFRVSSEILRVR